MELRNEFTVSAPIDETFAVLTDLERIAPCLPGAELSEVEGGEYRGTMSVKVGPITASFTGSASIVERDEHTHRAVLRAEGRDTGGKGNAIATVTALLEATSDGTHVTIETDLTITGRVAQFGRGDLADVSRNLTRQFAERLEAGVLSGSPAAVTVPAEPAPAVEKPTTAVSEAPVSVAAPAAAAAPTGAAPAPVDHFDTPGPFAKGVIRALIAALVLFVVLRRRKRRRAS